MTERGEGDRADVAASVADVLVPVAVDHPYSYRIPDGLTLAAGDFVTVSLGSREAFGVVWGLRRDARQKSQIRQRAARSAALAAKAADLPRLGRGLDAGPARHGPAHGDPGGGGLRGRAGANRRPRDRRRAQTADGGAPARAGGARWTGLPSARRTWRGRAGVSPGVIDALVDDGALEAIALAGRKARRQSRSGFLRSDPLADPGPGRAMR